MADQLTIETRSPFFVDKFTMPVPMGSTIHIGFWGSDGLYFLEAAMIRSGHLLRSWRQDLAVGLHNLLLDMSASMFQTWPDFASAIFGDNFFGFMVHNSIVFMGGHKQLVTAETSARSESAKTEIVSLCLKSPFRAPAASTAVGPRIAR